MFCLPLQICTLFTIADLKTLRGTKHAELDFYSPTDPTYLSNCIWTGTVENITPQKEIINPLGVIFGCRHGDTASWYCIARDKKMTGSMGLVLSWGRRPLFLRIQRGGDTTSSAWHWRVCGMNSFCVTSQAVGQPRTSKRSRSPEVGRCTLGGLVKRQSSNRSMMRGTVKQLGRILLTEPPLLLRLHHQRQVSIQEWRNGPTPFSPPPSACNCERMASILIEQRACWFVQWAWAIANSGVIRMGSRPGWEVFPTQRL